MSDKMRAARNSLVRIEKYLSTQPAEYCGNMDNHFSAELASIEAALASQPAVPEGFDIRRNSDGDIVVTRLSDMGAAVYSRDSPVVTEVMGWLFIDALLSATPSPP